MDDHLYQRFGIKKARINNEPNDEETPVWITSLPESVYATAMMSPMWITTKPGCNFESIFGIGMLWAIAYFSFILQSSAVYYVYDMTEEFDKSCQDSSKYLQLISLTCFSSLIWVDLFETFKMASYIYMLPLEKEIDGKLVEYIKFDHTGGPIGFTDDNESGISKFYRRIVDVFIFLPKIIIASILWYYGCKYILYSSSNEEVLLNSVSLNFLLEIDDYLYKAIISDYVKNTLINDWPSLSLCRAELDLSGDHCQASCRNRYGFYSAWSQPILPFFIIGLGLVIRSIIC